MPHRVQSTDHVVNVVVQLCMGVDSGGGPGDTPPSIIEVGDVNGIVPPKLIVVFVSRWWVKNTVLRRMLQAENDKLIQI